MIQFSLVMKDHDQEASAFPVVVFLLCGTVRQRGVSMNEVLLPCPHCGGSASIKTKYLENANKYGLIFAVCEICGAQGKAYYIPKRPKEERESELCARAARAWNLRYNSGSSGAVNPASETEQA